MIRNPKTYEILYVGYPHCKPEIYTEYQKQHNIEKLTSEDYDKLEKDFRDLEPKLLALMEYIDLNQYTHNVGYIKPLRIILYSLYFITWSYILIKSIHTLPKDSLLWLIPKYKILLNDKAFNINIKR